MKFRAKIKYNFMQAREAKLMGDENIAHAMVEFTLQEILADKPCFSMRELVIPWLKAGGIPEIINEQSTELKEVE